MDPIVKNTLLEILDLLHSEHPTTLCGYHWCEGVLLGRQTPCEHLRKCRLNREIIEHLGELKADVQRTDELSEVT